MIRFSPRAKPLTHVGIALAWASVVAFAMGVQSGEAPMQLERPSFEVASVKVVEHAATVSVIPRRSGDRVSYLTTFQMVLCYAYDIQPFQISGAGLSGTFDFEATTGGSRDENVIRQMFQALLADRFRLRVHRETRQMRIYTLSAENGGVKLKPSEYVGSGSDSTAPSGRVDMYMQNLGPQLVGKHASMAQLAEGLSRAVRGPVIDRTGIAGFFDFDLDCSFDQPQQDPTQPPDLAWAVSRAITRLGLALKPGKNPVDVLVVDQVEQPSAN
jgi:uncharacterized protein (TIGR03435 family)